MMNVIVFGLDGRIATIRDPLLPFIGNACMLDLPIKDVNNHRIIRHELWSTMRSIENQTRDNDAWLIDRR